MQKNALRVLVVGGGTGGHVFPVLAVVQAARNLASFEVEVFHVGTPSSIERSILARASIPSTSLSVAGLRGGGLPRMAGRALKLAAAVRPALRILSEVEPGVVMASGGYVSVPVVVAARLRRIPVLLFSADISAGLAIRLLAWLAQRIAVPAPEAASSLPKEKTFVSGYPVRPDLLHPAEKTPAKAQLGFDPRRPLLLCFGGSQGAHSLNLAVEQGLAQLLAATQVLHICGTDDLPHLQSLGQPGYRVEAFLDDMPLALAAADLCVSRSGASTLGELPAAALPAILVPYPFAGAHQKANAEVLVRAGAALLLENERVQRDLVPLVLELLANPERLQTMSAAMRAQSKPDAADAIAKALMELAA